MDIERLVGKHFVLTHSLPHLAPNSILMALQIEDYSGDRSLDDLLKYLGKWAELPSEKTAEEEPVAPEEVKEVSLLIYSYFVYAVLSCCILQVMQFCQLLFYSFSQFLLLIPHTNHSSKLPVIEAISLCIELKNNQNKLST